MKRLEREAILLNINGLMFDLVKCLSDLGALRSLVIDGLQFDDDDDIQETDIERE